MKSIIILLLLLISINIFPQNVDDSLLYKWIPKGITGLSVSQVSFSDWAQGGDNSLTWVLNGEFGISYYTKAYSFINNLKVAYGRTKLGNESERTNDNELYLENIFAYFVGWKIEPYISNTIRTTISTGYNYKVTPFVTTADFFDPGFVSQSIGFAYARNKDITTRLGIAFQETFTNKYRQYSDDPTTLDKVEAFKFENGLESVTDVNTSLGENLMFISKLRLFTRFNHMDVWDVRWDNTIAAQVNKYVNVKLNFLTLYEKSLSPKTQLKEALLLGITYALF